MFSLTLMSDVRIVDVVASFSVIPLTLLKQYPDISTKHRLMTGPE
jgi:hypothetical protein